MQEFDEIEVNRLREMGELETALSLVNQKIREGGLTSWLLNIKAEILIESGEIETAYECLSKGASEWGRDISILNNLAVVEAYRENVPAAIQVLEQVLELDPANDIARDNLQRLLELLPQPVHGSEAGTVVNEAPEVRRSRSGGCCRVSAIVSTFAGERFMAGRLQNLLDQNLGDELEIIVIDSNSPGKEGAIVEEFTRRHSNIRYLRTARRETIYQAWNRGIGMARGEFITNANTDDRLSPDALATLFHALESHPEAVLAYGDYFVTTRANQDFTGHIRCGYNVAPDYSPEIMLHACYMGPQPMWRRSVHDTHGFFDKSFRIAGDYEFWCRLAVHHDFLHVPEFLGLYYHNPIGAVNRDQSRSLQETRRVWEQYARVLPAVDPARVTGGAFVNLTTSPEQFINVCLLVRDHLPEMQQILRRLMLSTRWPHMITIIDCGSTDGTYEFLQEAYRRGVIAHLSRMDGSMTTPDLVRLAIGMGKGASHCLLLNSAAVIAGPDWMKDLLRRVPGESTERIVVFECGTGRQGHQCGSKTAAWSVMESGPDPLDAVLIPECYWETIGAGEQNSTTGKLTDRLRQWVGTDRFCLVSIG